MIAMTATTATTAPGSLVEMLARRAEGDPERVALTFVDHLGAEVERRTYRELDTRARAIAAALQDRQVTGPCLLLYPPGLEFVAAFFGCQYAGVPAVPVFPPDPSKQQQIRRLLAIAEETGPAVALTTQAILPVVQSACEALSGRFAELAWLGSDGLPDELCAGWRAPRVRGSDLAFLQYTSGSTSAPRGAMVTHDNLLDNLALIEATGRYHRDSRCVSWLPPYHDMGLIGCVLEPIYAGFPSVLMAPGTFLRRPHVWLQVLSRARGTASAAPNFAYDLCARKVTEDQRAGLDLSAWDIAYCGAEPVRAQTMERFVAVFGPHGFRPGTMFPCYGLAESTLIVTGGERGEGVAPASFAVLPLEQGEAVIAAAGGPESGARTRTLVACGRPLAGVDLRIVDPVRRVELAPGRVGEIWLRGPSVVQGYWQKPEATAATFAGMLESDPEAGPFLRTGDLGFCHGGALFVSGRIKDLIIVRGRNLLAEDIEGTVDRATPAIRRGGCVAFGHDVDGEEGLVIVAELEPDAAPAGAEGQGRDLDRAAREISARVFDEHRVAPSAVVLVGRGSLPRTSSGKLQRFQSRKSYADRQFRELFVHAPARSVGG